MKQHDHVPVRAVLLICAATLCFATLDAVLKSLSERYPVPLLVWARWTIQTLAILAWLAPRRGFAMLRTRHAGRHLARGVVLIASSVTFVYALHAMPLASVTAINYTTPMIVVLLAVPLLRERLTRPRVAFVIAGAIGMLLIVRPGSDVFRGASLLALGSATLYALFQISTRRMAAEDRFALLLYPALVGTVLLAVPTASAHEAFAIMTLRDAALLVAGGVVGTLGHLLFILAFQRAPASALTPFTYVHLVWAMLFGWIVFGTFPDGVALAGMAIIAGSGLMITVHERRRAALAPPANAD